VIAGFCFSNQRTRLIWLSLLSFLLSESRLGTASKAGSYVLLSTTLCSCNCFKISTNNTSTWPFHLSISSVFCCWGRVVPLSISIASFPSISSSRLFRVENFFSSTSSMICILFASASWNVCIPSAITSYSFCRGLIGCTGRLAVVVTAYSFPGDSPGGCFRCLFIKSCKSARDIRYLFCTIWDGSSPDVTSLYTVFSLILSSCATSLMVKYSSDIRNTSLAFPLVYYRRQYILSCGIVFYTRVSFSRKK